MKHLVEIFEPENYELFLEISAEKHEFSGKVKIRGTKKSDEKIRLNSHNLKINFAKIGARKIAFSDEKNEEIELEDFAKIGEKIELEIGFSGEINYGEMSGLYPSRYELQGEIREIFSTQFESTGARKVFPCVDEPAAKAEFSVEISVKNFAKDLGEKIEILGNMPEISRENRGEKSDEKIVVKFAKTPKMSTYLLAFAIGNFRKISRKTARGIEINVFATKAQNEKSLEFAADWAAKCVDFYEKYFGVEFPLAKIDHVAVPDFSAGAMENWGLITYREGCLLAAPTDSDSQKHYVATVIAHELAHQWFGNLVTMKWWDDLWLNESFANFMENFATNSLEPEWKIWQDYESLDVPAALNRDALLGVQSVREKVENVAEIDTLFDAAIVYAKGGRFLRMVHALVGDEIFRAALKKYFAKFAYKNAEMNDLWNEIWTEFSEQNPNFREKFGENFNLVKMMNDLLTRPGYPVVFAKILENGEISLKQERFLKAGENEKNEKPFEFPLFANSENAPKIMRENYVVFREKSPENFQLNMGNNSHFITNYSPEIRKNLFKNFAKFSDSDRLKIVNEQNILASSTKNYLRESEILPLLKHLKNEENFAVWSAASSTIRSFAKILEDDEIATENLKKLVLEITENIFAKLQNKQKSEKSNENDKKLFAILLARRIWADDRKLIDENLELFAKNKQNIAKIDGEIRATIFANAIKNGENEEFDFLLDKYKLTADATLKSDIAASLTSAKKPEQISRLIALLTDQNIVRPQDLFSWLIWLLGNKFSRTAAWRWLRENWNFIEKTYGGDQSFGEFPRYAGARLSSETELQEFREFFGPFRENPALKRAILLGENEISARVKWIAENQEDLAEKLTKFREK